MAEAFLVFGVDKLLDLLVRESVRFKGVDDQLNELKSDLKFLSNILKDADAKKHSLASVRNCLEEIKEVVFDTEDIIETFLLKEKLSKTKSIMKGMRRLSFITVNRRELASDMVGISKRISKVNEKMMILGVKGTIVDDGECSHPLQVRQREIRKTFPVVNNENDLVGLEENVKKLVGYLVEENSIRVVSITGMGGIGKTTLARQVFNHEMVKNHFDGVVWVCISQQFSRIDVWQTILKKLSSNYDEQRDSKLKEGELQDKLFKLLETSKSLIVLDDMWKEEDWDRIKPAFPSKKGCSKVLLTSRYESVGLHADSKCVTFKPNYLTIEESWTLFQSIAFPREEGTSEIKIDVEMEEMGKEMIKHCGGLPLVVKVLGGLLVGQHTLSEWKRVCENIGSHTIGGTSFNERNLSSVYHIMYLSFEELPFNLKQCFLYLAHFPEDCEINVEKLSYYWAAEAIPRPRGYDVATVREVGERYIEELVQRNMVISQRDAITSRFETCQLHDMMKEVCVRKAKEENFVDIVDVANSQSPRNSRRIAYTLGDDEEKSYDPKWVMKNPNLRSLLFFGLQNWYPFDSDSLHAITLFSPIFDMFRNWMPWGLLFTRLPVLRVLDLPSAQFKGEKLPSSIGKLIHLRYLSLCGAVVSHLPSSMRNLKQLLYLNLHVDLDSTLYIPNNVLNEMRELIYLYLPLKIDDKVKMELGNLVNLETLENFSTRHSSVKDLQRMTRLQTLSIKFIGGCTMETLSSSLSELSRLKNLTIDCWEEVQIPILEKLLHLHEVKLSYRSFSGRRMVCIRGGFPQLKKLEFYLLEEWEEWIVEEGSMPLLHTLTIWCCEKLKELPDGLRFITSLKELYIFEATLEFKEKLSRGGEDFYKVQHIPLLEIE